MTKIRETTVPSSTVTLRAVAERAGVSIAIASMVVRGNYRNAGKATVDRVLAVAKELGYDPSPNHAARRMALRRNGRDVVNQAVGLFFPSEFTHYNYFNMIFRNIADTLAAKHYVLVTTLIPFEMDKYTLPPIFRRGDIDGAIVIGIAPAMKQVQQYLRAEPLFASRPIISLIDPIPGCANIVTDDRAGGYAAAEHFLALGHRHLLHFSEASHPHRQRVAGYQQALQEYGLDPDVSLHFTCWTNADLQYSAKSLLEMLHAHPEITAIFAPNDAATVDIRATLLRGGYRIPEDISLVGYDDTDPILDATGENMLTTVRVPLEAVGREAAQLLLRCIAGESTADSTLTLPVSLIVRHSTAPPRARCD